MDLDAIAAHARAKEEARRRANEDDARRQAFLDIAAQLDASMRIS